MIQSMTAFSQVQFQYDAVMLTWELRSLNHRYLDVSFRLPESLRHMEAKLRLALRGKFNRGKLDIQLRLTENHTNQSSLTVNDSLVQALIQESKRLSMAYGLPDDLKLSDLLAWPGVMTQALPVDADLERKIEELFQEGLEQLLVGRRREGAVLEAQIQSRLPLIRREIDAAKENTASMLSSARKKLVKRLDDLQMNVADMRLEQELALILTRLDVSEELDRLEAHVDEVARVLNADEASGKRLDFLMQELNREANTLSSKSDSLALSQHAIQTKVLIEQIREQIQNIE